MIRHSGFTLIEIIIVIVIVGMLASLVYPRYERTVERAKAAEAVGILDTMGKAQVAFRMEFGQYTLNLDDLDVEGTGAEHFNDPVITGTVDAPVISMQQSSGDYTLQVVPDGTITCTDGGSSFCESIGY